MSILRVAPRLLGPAALLLVGCSLINAPDEVNPGNGGSGAAGGTGGAGAAGGSGAGGSGGAPPMCTMPEDCVALTTDCAMGDCVNNACVAMPLAAGTSCGAAGTDCDPQDQCDGAGTCVANVSPEGSFCDDCPAGPGACAACAGGTCGDCSTRATEKTFRHPMAASGWTFTGSWGIHYEAPMAGSGNIPPTCQDGVDNDGDTLIDFPADPKCASAADEEFNGTAACSNGFDDDGDGLNDLADPGCSSAADDHEENSIPFDHGVLGSDGNRVRPYTWHMSEREVSSAISPPTVLPTNLEFLSWNLDEGFFYDLKAVSVSLDGSSWTDVAVCPQNNTAPFVFCQAVSTRAADAWDFVSLPLPGGFAGQVGFVRFTYDTRDGCCNFERGWYVDALNFATDCACQNSADCDLLDGTCSSGLCAGSGECWPVPQNVGMACTNDGTSDECSTDQCDSHGVCLPGLVQEGGACEQCDDPEGLCAYCSAGNCESCPDLQRFNIQAPDPLFLSRWQFEGDWTVFNNCIPQNTVTPNETLCFTNPNGSDVYSDPHLTPHIANDGSRAFNPSPPTIVSEIETAAFRTPPTVIPATLTFRSWHQDRGGNDMFVPQDTKVIRVSTDGGMTYQPVFNCSGNNTVAFCQPWPANTNRAVDDWDDISLTVPAGLVGQTGIFEFRYDTVNSGQGWERGWRIDDMNIARCQ